MKASLKALVAKLRPANIIPAKAGTPAPAAPAVTEADDEQGYSSVAVETIINRLVDQLEAKQSQIAALVKVNHELTAQLTTAKTTLKQFYALPRNRYWNQRKG